MRQTCENIECRQSKCTNKARQAYRIARRIHVSLRSNRHVFVRAVELQAHPTTLSIQSQVSWDRSEPIFFVRSPCLDRYFSSAAVAVTDWVTLLSDFCHFKFGNSFSLSRSEKPALTWTRVYTVNNRYGLTLHCTQQLNLTSKTHMNAIAWLTYSGAWNLAR